MIGSQTDTNIDHTTFFYYSVSFQHPHFMFPGDNIPSAGQSRNRESFLFKLSSSAVLPRPIHLQRFNLTTVDGAEPNNNGGTAKKQNISFFMVLFLPFKCLLL